MHKCPMMDRRTFIRIAGLAGMSCLLPKALASSKKKFLKIDSKTKLEKLQAIVEGFSGHFYETGQGKKLKQFFSGFPQPKYDSIDYLDDIVFKGGIAYFPNRHFSEAAAFYSPDDDSMHIKKLNPVVELTLLRRGVAHIPLIRLHETIHRMQDQASPVDKLADIANEHQLRFASPEGSYLIFYRQLPEDNLIETYKQTNDFVLYHSSLPRKEVDAFYEDISKLTGKPGLRDLEKYVLEHISAYQRKWPYIMLIRETQANFAYNSWSYTKGKLVEESLIQHLQHPEVLYLEESERSKLKPEHFSQAVSNITSLYGSMRNAGLSELEQHRYIAGVVGKTPFNKLGEAVMQHAEEYGTRDDVFEEKNRLIRQFCTATKEAFYRYLENLGLEDVVCRWQPVESIA